MGDTIGMGDATTTGSAAIATMTAIAASLTASAANRSKPGTIG